MDREIVVHVSGWQTVQVKVLDALLQFLTSGMWVYVQGKALDTSCA